MSTLGSSACVCRGGKRADGCHRGGGCGGVLITGLQSAAAEDGWTVDASGWSPEVSGE